MNKNIDSRRVVFVYHEFTYGGASKSLSFWVNTLTNAGMQVSIITYKSLSTPKYKISDDVKVVGPILNTRKPVLTLVNSLLTVIYAIFRIRPHLVIGLMSVNSFYGFIGARLIGAKVIVSERGCPTRENGILTHLKHLAMNFSDGGIFQTKGAMSFYSQRLQAKSVVIPNPAISSLKQRDFHDRIGEFLFVGRFEVRQKRHDILLNALKILVTDKPDVKVNFIGDGPDFERVKTLVDQLDLNQNVNFMGVISNVPEILEKYKFFVITSDYEGIPNSLIEAMVAGMACITTDCEPGGARELIKCGHNGLLVKRGSVCEVAEAMKRLLDDNKLSLKLGRNARNIVNECDANGVAARILNYVEKFT